MTDQTDRDRIAALFRHPPGGERLGDATPGEIADAVLSVLPATADRATVLREAAEALGRMDYDTDSNDYGYDTYRDAWNGGVMDGADLLRRLAAETQQPEAHSCPNCEGVDPDTCLTNPDRPRAETDGEALRCVCGETAVHSGDNWVHEPGKGGTCLYRPKARPRCPDCRTPHDLTPGSMGARACVSILASIADRPAAAQQPKEARP